MKFLAALALLALSSSAYAASFVVGVEGFAGDTNNWPGGEPPSAAIDGVGQKYLNFGKENTGIIVTPGSGSTTVTGITLYSANDAQPRDPASYAVYGTNNPLGAGPYNLNGWTLIDSAAIALPASRNGGGVDPLLLANSASGAFANANAYTSYAVIFPTLFDSGAANSMQVAEIQLTDGGGNVLSPGDAVLGVQLDANLIPEPSSGILALLGLGAFALRRKRS